MARIAKQVILANTTFVAPAGCTALTLTPVVTNQILANPAWAQNVTAAIDALGNVFTCGASASVGPTGILGNGGTTVQSSPVAVVGGYNFQQLSIANTTAFGITTQGKLYGWGSNTNGQLGQGGVLPVSSPVAITSNLTFKKVIALYDGTSVTTTMIALAANGTVYTCGAGPGGTLGNGAVTPISTPVAVAGTNKFVNIWASRGTVYGLTAAGALYGWGYNDQGQLGVGTVVNTSSPVAVLGGLTFNGNVALYPGASNGFGNIFAQATSGTWYAWGYNGYGLCGAGSGTITGYSSPVAVLNSSSFATIVVSGGTQALGLTTAGQAYCWGSNTYGALGNNNIAVTGASSPIAVVGGLSFVQVAADDQYGTFYGLTAAGAGYAWGYNGYAQLGNGNSTSQSSPVAVSGGITFQAIGYIPIGMGWGLSVQGQLYTWGSGQGSTAGNSGVGTPGGPGVTTTAWIGGFSNGPAQTLNAPVKVSVTPGTSYAVVINSQYVSFGTTSIQQKGASGLIIEFEQ